VVEHTEDGKPTRRTFMAGGAAAIGLGAAVAGARPARASAAQQRLIDKALASATSNAQLSDVKHVVILMQENRSSTTTSAHCPGCAGSPTRMC
jgi:phospholipase C